MRFPSLVDELCLHERVLQGDPVAPADVFQTFIEPLLNILEREMACDPEEANVSAVDAVFSYLREPERYDHKRGRLSTYLTQAAKHRVRDHRRSASARARREQDFASVVELQATSPKEELERSVEVGLVLKRLEEHVPEGRDREALRLLLWGERSSERWAEVLGLTSLPTDERRREVKRHRDRLMKFLERFGKEDPDDES
jgi:RNA polymerase sigma-70 factor, ECF subfamily